MNIMKSVNLRLKAIVRATIQATGITSLTSELVHQPTLTTLETLTLVSLQHEVGTCQISNNTCKR